MDFHHASIALLESFQSVEDAVVDGTYTSWYVSTPVWEEWADSEEALNFLLDDAALGGLEAVVSEIPF